MNRQSGISSPMTPREQALLHSIIGVCEEIIALAKKPATTDMSRILDCAEARLYSIVEDFYSTGEESAEGLKVVVDMRPIRSIPDLRGRLRRNNRKWDEPGLVVIESLQHVAGMICTEESKVSVATLLRTIETLANEMSIPILVLSSQSRTDNP